jgi:xanthine dehydrogenase YagR molybdenum-binding subunit
MPADTVLGNVEAGLASAAIRLDQTYTTPMCHHNPMEPHTAVATWPTTCRLCIARLKASPSPLA